MTTRKYNAIVKACETAKYSKTFHAILDKLAEYVDLDTLTAKQIADIIDFGNAQKRYGYEQAAGELL